MQSKHSALVRSADLPLDSQTSQHMEGGGPQSSAANAQHNGTAEYSTLENSAATIHASIENNRLSTYNPKLGYEALCSQSCSRTEASAIHSSLLTDRTLLFARKVCNSKPDHAHHCVQEKHMALSVSCATNEGRGHLLCNGRQTCRHTCCALARTTLKLRWRPMPDNTHQDSLNHVSTLQTVFKNLPIDSQRFLA